MELEEKELLQTLKTINANITDLVKEVQETTASLVKSNEAISKRVDVLQNYLTELIVESTEELSKQISSLDAKISQNEKDLHVLEMGYHKTALDVAQLKLVK